MNANREPYKGKFRVGLFVKGCLFGSVCAFFPLMAAYKIAVKTHCLTLTIVGVTWFPPLLFTMLEPVHCDALSLCISKDLDSKFKIKMLIILMLALKYTPF